MRTGKGFAFWLLSIYMTFCLTEASWAAISDELFVELCEKGTVQGIRIALLNGANPNARDGEDGMTALMVAASLNKTPEVIDLLLKHGAYINEKSNSGGTALMYAALNNPNPGILSFLINAGADIDAKDDYGLTALDIARRDANKSVQTVLEGAAPVLK